MSAEAPSTLSVNVKGPQDVKLSITVSTGATVAELKALVTEANGDFPVEQQRLIYSGRVLKDDDLISKYGLKDGHTIHLVSFRCRGAAMRGGGAGVSRSAWKADGAAATALRCRADVEVVQLFELRS